jgi:hypothetical protein
MENNHFVGIIKLITKEELIGNIIYDDETDIIMIENPMVVVPVESGNSQIKMKGFQLEPWLRSCMDDMVAVSRDKIITVAEASTDVAIFYLKIISSNNLNKIAKSNSNKKHNGYITKVNEARMLLEKIYNNH